MSIVGGHYRHGLRRLLPRAVDERGRAATPLELLFDLTLVASFSVAGDELAHGIAVGHGGSATIAFVFAIFAVVWAWINVTWFASAFDNDDWLYRVLTLVQMAGVVVLAVGLPPLFASIEDGVVLDNRMIVAGYVIMRVALILQWARVARSNPQFRSLARTYIVFGGSAQIGWVVLALLPLPTTPALVIAAVLFTLEASGPAMAERRADRRNGGSNPWHPHHLAERFALLTIIALGETVFGTLSSAAAISTADGWTVDAVVVVGAGVALSFALWWTYFLVPHAAVLAVQRPKALVWGYAHVVLYVAIAAVGAGLHVVGYAHDPHYEIDATAVAASIAVPVSVFMLVRLLLQVWLVSAPPRDAVFQIAATALPLVTIALAAVGVPVWTCLLVVLAAPVAVIVSFELGGWRSLEAQLGKVVPGAESGPTPTR